MSSENGGGSMTYWDNDLNDVKKNDWFISFIYDF